LKKKKVKTRNSRKVSERGGNPALPFPNWKGGGIVGLQARVPFRTCGGTPCAKKKEV